MPKTESRAIVDTEGFLPHTSHWGVFSARLHDDVLDVRPYL